MSDSRGASRRSLVFAVLLAACGGSSSTSVNPPPPPPPPGPPVAVATVEVHNNFFSPETVSLLAGGEVTWRWIGQGHNVTSVLTPTFAPNSRTEDAPFTHGPIRFNTPGSYRYICTVHGSVVNGQTTGMRGVIVVQ